MPKADRLSPAAVAMLKEPHVANFVTLMPDGSPQVTVVWVDVEDDGSHVVINTSDGRQKMMNVGRDPRVAISIVDSKNAYRTVQVRGTIVDVNHDDAVAHIRKLSKKYRGNEDYEIRPGVRRVILRIKPTHVNERGV